MQRFIPAKVVYAGPGSHRPAVVELPVNGAHAVAPQTSEMLHAVADGISLKQLRGIDQVFKAAGIEIVVGEIAQNISVAALAFLMVFHDPGEAVPVLRGSKGFHGFHGRKTFKAVFRTKTELFLPVGGEGNTSMPDLPIMGIAPGIAARIVKATAGRWRAGPVIGIRAIFGRRFR